MILPDHSVKNIKTIIESSDSFVIVPHVNPDGDTIGASLGWYNLLLNMGKSAVVVTPNDCPDSLKWFNGSQHVIVYKDKPDEAKKAFGTCCVLLCLDFNHIDRCDEVKPHVESFVGKTILIDHHPYPQNFCNEMISMPEASSTSELSYWIMSAMGYRHLVTKHVAEALYTGIITDTGALNHNSSRPEVYHAVADLLSCGIEKSEIHDAVFNNYTEGRLRLLGDVISRNMRVLYEYNAAYLFITESQQKFFGFKPGDSEGFVNIPLSIKGIRFCAMFTEMTDHVKVSLRSKGTFPTNAFAAQYYNGGGHLNASGGKIPGKLFDAMHLFEEGVKQYKQYLFEQ